MNRDNPDSKASLTPCLWSRKSSRWWSWMWVADEFIKPLARLGFSRVEDFFKPSGDTPIDLRQTRILRLEDERAGGFYVKSYARKLGGYFLRSSKAAGEAVNLGRLQRMGIDVPKLAAVGEWRSCGKLLGAFIVTKELKDYLPLDLWIKKRWKVQSGHQKEELLGRLADIFKIIHGKGYFDVDTGLKNFLYNDNQPGRIFKIDSPKGKSCKSGKGLCNDIVADLARPWRDLKCNAFRDDAQKFLCLYAKKANIDEGLLTDRVERLALKMCYKRARSTIANVGRYAGKHGAWVRPELRKAGMGPEDFVHQDNLGDKPVTRHGSRQTALGSASNYSWFLKKIKRVYVKDGMRWFWFWRRFVDKALAELGALELFGSMGIPAPRILGYSSAEKTGGRWLAVERIAGAMGVDDLLDSDDMKSPRARFELIRATGAMVGDMHRMGLSQPDLYMKHLLAKNEDGRWRVYIIDLQRSWNCKGRSFPRAVKELARLFDNSFRARSVSWSDRLCFAKAYDRVAGNGDDIGLLIRQVLGRAKKGKS